MNTEEVEFREEIDRLIKSGDRHIYDFDELDEEIEAVCDELELSLLVEARQLRQIEDSQRSILGLIARGDEDSLLQAANEAQAIVTNLAVSSL
jgi:hypothetical protein